MNTFTRPADWLRQIFTPSRFGWNPPSAVSQEVSLVQPYDGGGYATFPVGQWVLTGVAVAGATGEITLIDLPQEEIGRIMAVSVVWQAGVAPVCSTQIRLPGANPVGSSLDGTPTVLNELFGINQRCPILPPGHRLLIRYHSGDGATVITARALVCRAPLGSVFYT